MSVNALPMLGIACTGRPAGLLAVPRRRQAERRGLLWRAEAEERSHQASDKKVVVVGSTWAGLAAAHHLSKQGINVTVLDASCPSEVGINGFRYADRNIFSLVNELGIKPFTNWTRSAQYSLEGMEIELPIYRDLPRLPAPFGALFYTQFMRLPLVDRLTSLPVMAAVIDFDNTDVAWRKYDPSEMHFLEILSDMQVSKRLNHLIRALSATVTARELFKQYGCSERLFHQALSPIIQLGLSAPAEQCSATATLGMLYYYILAHQQDFDVVWCRGTIEEKIFRPWKECIKLKGGEFHGNKMVTDFSVNEDTSSISKVICGQQSYPADAVILALNVTQCQDIVKKGSVLKTKQEFLNALNLAATDVVSIRIKLDRKVNIPKPSNACSGFEETSGWTFFDLNAIYDEYKDESVSILAADFYYASQFLPLTDDQIVAKAKSLLTKCIKEFEDSSVMEQEVFRYPKSLTHFFPGSYRYMMRGSTSFSNLFMAGDWIINRHGSWSHEKAYVTGLEAANRVVDCLGGGEFAKIIPVEEDEPHIQALRSLNKSINEIRTQIPLSDFFLQ